MTPELLSRPGLHQAVLDALLEHVAVLDRDGAIVAVNRAWRDFASANGGEGSCGTGTNYLEVCWRSNGPEGEEAARVLSGLRAVLAGKRPSFTAEYPCHSPTQRRFFLLYATPLPSEDGLPLGAVVSHIDITRRRVLEEEREILRLEIQAVSARLLAEA